jgi:hypothetical protein
MQVKVAIAREECQVAVKSCNSLVCALRFEPDQKSDSGKRDCHAFLTTLKAASYRRCGKRYLYRREATFALAISISEVGNQSMT